MTGRTPDAQFKQLVKDVEVLKAQFATHQHQTPNQVYEPDTGGAVAYFRGTADDVEVANGVTVYDWTITEDFADGATVNGDGHVEPELAGIWQVDVIAYAYPDGGVASGARFRVRAVALNGAGSEVDSTYYAQEYIDPVGNTVYVTPSGAVNVPEGGSISVAHVHFNTTSTGWCGWQLFAHYVGPAPA